MSYAIYLLSLWGWTFVLVFGSFCTGVWWERLRSRTAGDGDA